MRSPSDWRYSQRFSDFKLGTSTNLQQTFICTGAIPLPPPPPHAVWITTSHSTERAPDRGLFADVAAVFNGGKDLIAVFQGREESVMAQVCVEDTPGCIKRPGNFEGDDEGKLSHMLV
jgi:hypothetical protein